MSVLAPAPSDRLARFTADVARSFPIIGKTVTAYVADLRARPEYSAEAGRLLDLADRLGAALGLDADGVLDAFAEFCLTFLREQEEFLKTGEYRNAALGFEHVRAEVYDDDEYMTSYMVGHLLSCVVFPHHYEQYRFFQTRFVPALPAAANVFEFGQGHGLWLSECLAGHPARRGTGVDVSPRCVVMAGEMMRLRGVGPDRVALSHADAVRYDLGDTAYDGMIASGLLEHIEDPAGFLRRVRRNLKPGTGRLFTMVPTNTAHPDHLVLFREVDEIRDLFRAAGFSVVEERDLEQGTLGADRPAGAASRLHLAILTPTPG
jgi:2-polyprenyl-3-methyl-5-hydroxy-6-metoxy-1,4-benzoquinol methylase